MAKQYFTSIPRKPVFITLGVMLVVVIGMFLFVPHYKPLRLATTQELLDARRDIIKQQFVANTSCKNDNEPKAERVKEFNQFFKVNAYANRAVIRGCNDGDYLLAKDDKTGKWVKTEVNIILTSRQNPDWQKTCLIDDITKADDKVRPENNSIDSFNKSVCDKLLRTSYIHF